MNKIISPIIYALSAPVIFFLVGVSTAWVETTIGLHTLWRVGDIDIAIATLCFGTIIFGLASHLLASLERMKCPTIKDHLRYSAILYMVSIPSLIHYVKSSLYLSAGLWDGLYGLFIAILFLGIIINGIVFFIKNLRSADR